MGHTIAEKDKLLVRVRQLKAQLAGIEAAFKEDAEPAAVLPLVTEARGVINGLIADVLEDHIRIHVLQEPRGLPQGAAGAAEALIDAVHGYMGP